MKKLISITLATLALSALAVTAFAAVAPAAGDTTAAAQEETAEIAAKLTQEQALAAALKDAGEKEADVTVTKNELTEKETEDGETVAVYTVKFSTDTTTYKYYVDANTGAILYKSVVFQSADVVFKSRRHGDADGRSGKASGEMDADAVAGATPRMSGRTGGHRSAAAETDTASVDTTEA